MPNRFCTVKLARLVCSFNPSDILGLMMMMMEHKSSINLEHLTCIVKRMSLNDDQFRQIMVGDNAAEYRDRES